MVEERAAERAHEEVVEERVALGELPEIGVLQVRGAVIAHGEPAGVREQREVVVLAAVDLRAVRIESVDEIPGVRRRGDARADADDREGPVRQIVECLDLVQRLRVLCDVEGPLRHRQHREGLALAVALHRGLARLRDPVRARELPEQIIEAAVLHVEHEDVGQPVEPAGRLSEHRRCQRRPDKSRAASEPHPKPHPRPPLFVRL